MKPGPLPDSAHNEEKDPLWNLLASSPLSQPDPWFAVRTVARCRREGLKAEKSVNFLSFARVWRWTLGSGVFAVCLTMGLMFSQVQTEKTDKQKNVQEAFEIMASIDNDSDSPAAAPSWQDNSL
jgi:hypothetical protein